LGGLGKPAEGECVVLVVDDDAVTREVLKHALEAAGYQVRLAPDGAAALSLLRGAAETRTPPCDVVLLDLMMPVMNGWDFRAKQKTDPALQGIPILLMSAGSHLAAVSGELEVAGSISKPVQLTELFGKIAGLRR
jgi:two-component system chemotaxis response regulator CheY